MSPSYLPARKKSYAKHLIGLGLVITIGFSTIFGYVMWESRDREREQARQAASNVVATISSEIERNLELYDLSLQAVVDGVKLPELSQLSAEVRQLVLFDRAATAKDMGSILVLDQSGRVVTDSRTLTPQADNHAQRDFFVVHAYYAKTGLYVSRPWLAPTGEHLIAISRRLSNLDGSFAGAVVGTLRLSYFHDIFRKLKLGSLDSLTLVREDGSFVMRAPFAADMIGRNMAAAPVFQRIAAAPSGSFEQTASLDGVQRMFVFQRVGEHPLILSYGLSVDDIYVGWRSKAWRLGSILLALCALNISLVMFLTRALKHQREAERRLSVMATTDSLTGLCNRRRLDEIFDVEWRRAMRTEAPVALLMIDADGFKVYNDRFGHQAGDDALISIARCIETTAQRATDMSARYGGEEFAVLLPGSSIGEAIDLGERIRSGLLALRDDQQNRPDSIPTVSIGAASMVPRQGLQPRDLIKAADTALYAAKRKGRNRTEPPLRAVGETRNLMLASG